MDRVAILITLLAGFITVGTQGSSIVPGALWADTAGNPIQAHGAGFLKHNGYFYWFGEDKTANSHLFHNVNAYRSTDLVSWEFVGNALSADPSNSSLIGSQAVVERPKVIYNPKTNKFILWFHLDSSNYGLAKLGVAVSDNVEGPYSFVKGISPFDTDSRDMTVWVDDDGTGYVIYATAVNLNTVIARLTPDFLDVESKVYQFDGVRWEAYAMFKKNGLYYLITSGTTGWASNSNYYTYSRYLNQSWAPAEKIAPYSSNTYNSQSNNVIALDDGTFIFTADRWFSSALADSRYIWLPIEFLENNTIRATWRSEWWIDTTTGKYGNSNSRKFEGEDGTLVLLSGDAVVLPCSACSNGLSAGYVGKNGTLEISPVNAARNSTYSVIVGFQNGDSVIRQAVVSVNGVQQLTLSFPITGQSVKELVFQVQLTQGANSIRLSNPNARTPDFDYFRVQCYFENCELSG